MDFRRRALAVLFACSAFALGTADADAFDTGPHGDITVDALTSEGFNKNAANVGRMENWFVDMYSNASANPYSGYAPWWKELLSGALGRREHWPKAVVDGAATLHFDSSVPAGNTTAGIEAEWNRLHATTYALVQRAKAERNPLTLLTAIGMSLHQLQDFYAHGNFAEPRGIGIFEAPGWDSRGQGRTPTWFDVPDLVRDSVLVRANAKPGATDYRPHGGFKSSASKGMNKDDPGRPNYTNAYMASYFATRQWIRAIRTWLSDEPLWAAAQNWRQKLFELNWDIGGAVGMSTYTGHLYGEGEPFAPGNSANRGDGGSIVGAYVATKTYFELHGRSIYRKMFEKLVPDLARRNLPSVDYLTAPVASSRDIQQQTRFVRLQVTSMKGYDLGDIGPDDADLYARGTIAGQSYTSPVIQGHDSFSFKKPYYPFTFIKSIPKSFTGAEPITQMTVEIRTSSSRYAGTDDDVYLRISPTKRFALDKSLYDDFERGDRDTYSVPIDGAARDGLTMADLQRVQIEKSKDGIAGGWKLRGVTLKVNGRTVYTVDNIEQWLENNHRTWVAPNFVPQASAGNRVPVWVDLREDDLGLYGGDDQGDVNPDDARDAVAVGYPLGAPPLPGTSTGGHKYGGRLGKGGDKARIGYKIETLDTVPPPGPPAPPSTGKPDLVITYFDQHDFTIKNQGTAAAGPFTMKINLSLFLSIPGLAAGASYSQTYAGGCSGGTYSATVDYYNAVVESNELNNDAGFESIC